MSEKAELQKRLRVIIQTTCNVVGCANCSLKWEGGCSATELDAKIMDIEMQDPTDKEI